MGKEVVWGWEGKGAGDRAEVEAMESRGKVREKCGKIRGREELERGW